MCPPHASTPCGFLLLRCCSRAVDRSLSAIDSSSLLLLRNIVFGIAGSTHLWPRCEYVRVGARLYGWPCLLYADAPSCGSRCHPKLPSMVIHGADYTARRGRMTSTMERGPTGGV